MLNCLNALYLLYNSSFLPSFPLLKQLQWLPDEYRIQLKLSTLTYMYSALATNVLSLLLRKAFGVAAILGNWATLVKLHQALFNRAVDFSSDY